MNSTFTRALDHHKAGRLQEAEALYRQLRNWRPAWVLGNLGMIFRVTGRLEEAEAVLRKAVAADPKNLGNIHSLGLTLLQLGQYAEGWRHFEARRSLTPLPKPGISVPPWRGESLRGKRILVMGEQGLGDQILFSRFIPLLAEIASEVIFAAGRPLVSYFQPLPARVFHPDSWADVQADVWTSLGSLPHWLGAGPADAPAPTLTPRAGDATPVGFGLMLAGGGHNPNHARLPPPPMARAIRGLAPFTDLDPSVSGARDFAQTAEIVAGLQGVVTVDTSVAHLAGAMGKPCWILVPRPAVDWYTSWRDDRSPWYPSARVVRQREPGNWVGVIADVAEVMADAP
jgi:hypothetical protein